MKSILGTLLAVVALAGCASASATTAPAAHTETTHIVLWSVNSDGPYFREILTGAVGDYGPGVTVQPDGTVDPEHRSEMELKLSRGSFRLSIATLTSEFTKVVSHWPYDRTTCSIHGALTATAPVVAGSGTGRYRGITGAFTLTISLDEDWLPEPGCNETTGFQAQILLIEGTGSIRL